LEYQLFSLVRPETATKQRAFVSRGEGLDFTHYFEYLAIA